MGKRVEFTPEREIRETQEVAFGCAGTNSVDRIML